MSEEKKTVSKAPAPIIPLSGRGSHFPARRPAAKKPNWEEWTYTPEVRLWQACALSLDIEPHSLKQNPNGWMAGPGRGPIFGDDSFPSDAVKEDFELRQRVLLANLSFPPDVPTPSNFEKVRLHEFAAWCVDIIHWVIPQELAALAKDVPQAAPADDEEPADDAPDEKLAALFDPVPVETLENMFPAKGQWKSWADKAKANGLIDAREERAMFNPYKAGVWFIRKGAEGWDDARLNRTLAKNLPARSRDDAHLLTWGID